MTFLVSAACVGLGILARPVLGDQPDKGHLLRETAAGFRLVWTNPVLRAIALVVLGSSLFAVVPEGLGAAWAAALAPTSSSRRGLDQALIMMAGPTGAAVGALIISRLVAPHRRRGLIRPLAVAVPAALVPTLVLHSAVLVTALVVVSGFAVGGLITSTNYLFVSALPAPFRARAFGVMQFGLQFVQAAALFATGLLADHVGRLATVVGAWSLAGAVGMVVVGMAWPSAGVIDRTVAEIHAENEAAEAYAGRTAFEIPARDEAVAVPARDDATGAFAPRQATGSAEGVEPVGGQVEPGGAAAAEPSGAAESAGAAAHPLPGVRGRRAARAAERPGPRQEQPDHGLSRPGSPRPGR